MHSLMSCSATRLRALVHFLRHPFGHGDHGCGTASPCKCDFFSSSGGRVTCYTNNFILLPWAMSVTDYSRVLVRYESVCLAFYFVYTPCVRVSAVVHL